MVPIGLSAVALLAGAFDDDEACDKGGKGKHAGGGSENGAARVGDTGNERDNDKDVEWDAEEGGELGKEMSVPLIQTVRVKEQGGKTGAKRDACAINAGGSARTQKAGKKADTQGYTGIHRLGVHVPSRDARSR